MRAMCSDNLNISANQQLNKIIGNINIAQIIQAKMDLFLFRTMYIVQQQPHTAHTY